MAYEYLPEELRAMIGVESGPFVCPVDVERALITHWIEAYEDGNPLYSNEEYAKTTKYGGIVAPPAMLLTWTFPLRWTPDAGHVDRGYGDSFPRVKSLLGMPLSLASMNELEWYKPAMLGDRLTFGFAITDISPQKMTRVGQCHFVTQERRVRNQSGEMVGVVRSVSCCYRGNQNGDAK